MSRAWAQFVLGGVMPEIERRVKRALDAPRPPPIEDGGIERLVLHGGIEFADGADETLGVDLELPGQLLDGRGLRLGDLADPVLLAKEGQGLLIEDLERRLLGLPDDGLPVLDVGEVAEVRALVDEALAVDIHDDAERVGVLLEHVPDLAIAEGRRVQIPLDGMTGGPVAIGLRPDVQRHADALARVVASAPHAGEVPVRPEIARPHFRVRLEAATGQDHRAGRDLDEAFRGAHDEPRDAALVIGEEAPRPVAVAHLDAHLARAIELHLHEAGPAAHRLDIEPAPELMLALDLIGLAGEHEDPAETLAPHPGHGGTRALDEVLGHVEVRAPLRHPHQVVVELVLRVGRDHDGARLLLGDVGQDVAPEILEPLMGETKPARREEGVAAALGLRRLLDDQHRSAGFSRGKGRAEGGVAASRHHDVVGRTHR